MTWDYYLVQEKRFLITLKADKPTPELATEPTKQKKSKLKL